eukprot:CAMPEP_0175764118 /NCGR_PEP_ID=MMETSP0097-20121207/68091_1 /TAXON_ID=311494 /ORGANISM="Alexandrium monilatum, Strain CCMP3105" /LENGTH=142 /DNA_ID=CAMNT_0017073875 /DNA_START=137 /DNA_END=563 /DNA_ORIENTATION=-
MWPRAAHKAEGSGSAMEAGRFLRGARPEGLWIPGGAVGVEGMQRPPWSLKSAVDSERLRMSWAARKEARGARVLRRLVVLGVLRPRALESSALGPALLEAVGPGPGRALQAPNRTLGAKRPGWRQLRLGRLARHARDGEPGA